MNDHDQANRPPHLPHMSRGQVAGSQADRQHDHFRNTTPKVGMPHMSQGVIGGRQGDQLRNPAPEVSLPHVQTSGLASDQTINNGNDVPNVRHSVPSLHPTPKLGLPHVSGVTVSQTLPPGSKPPMSGLDYNNKTASLDRSKDAAPPPVSAKPDKKRHSVLGIFKKAKKDKEKWSVLCYVSCCVHFVMFYLIYCILSTDTWS